MSSSILSQPHVFPLFQPGQFGVARLATHLKSGKTFAVKCIDKTRFQRPRERAAYLAELKSEVELMAKLPQHPNVIQYVEVSMCDSGKIAQAVAQIPT